MTQRQAVKKMKALAARQHPGCALALLITDEPTTALSATVQAQIVLLLRQLKETGIARNLNLANERTTHRSSDAGTQDCIGVPACRSPVHRDVSWV